MQCPIPNDIIKKIMDGSKNIEDRVNLINNIMRMKREGDYVWLTYEGFEFFYKFYEHFFDEENYKCFCDMNKLQIEDELEILAEGKVGSVYEKKGDPKSNVMKSIKDIGYKPYLDLRVLPLKKGDYTLGNYLNLWNTKGGKRVLVCVVSTDYIQQTLMQEY